MSVSVRLLDFEPVQGGVADEILAGMRSTPKQLPAKYFYDERGSKLFDRITELEEYYPMRTEQSIMREHAGEMADALGPDCLVVEYGSGSSTKTRELLDHLHDPAGYVPIDISKEHLLRSARAIATDYPHIEVLPVCADYEQNFYLPTPAHATAKRVVYFPGSTIGNQHPDAAVTFLQRTARLVGSAGQLLIGVDLRKDIDVLNRAYNDSEGVTAAFNVNMLLHLNRVADTNFNIEQFAHVAFYNEEAGRIEMHLESKRNQTVDVGGQEFELSEGERIWTESSYKYTPEGFAELAAKAGYVRADLWMDDKRYFGVMLFTVA